MKFMDELEARNFDAVVVGSGPGGATVACELSRRGRRVVILERGGEAPVRGTGSQMLGQLLVPGRSLRLTPELLAVARGITTGGSSIFYCACALDPPHGMLEARGVDISGAIAELKQELPYGPLADELVGPFARRLMESAVELGHEWRKLPKLVHQERCRAECDRCIVGCPHGAKWTAREYVDDARRHGAELVPRARVRRVLVDGGTAFGVEAAVDGRRFAYTGRHVILAAGGIGSAVILRESGIARAGRDFFVDPLVFVVGAVDDVDGGRELPMATGLRLEDEDYLLADLALPGWLWRLLAVQVLRVDRVLAHRHTLPVMVKIKDRLGGRVTASGGVRKRLGPTDRAAFRRGIGRARDILANAGARHVFHTWYLATHPGGTAKIGDVVSSDLETEYRNLYVCDASVIPEAWGLPPVLTLLGLGRRLANHLAGATDA